MKLIIVIMIFCFSLNGFSSELTLAYLNSSDNNQAEITKTTYSITGKNSGHAIEELRIYTSDSNIASCITSRDLSTPNDTYNIANLAILLKQTGIKVTCTMYNKANLEAARIDVKF